MVALETYCFTVLHDVEAYRPRADAGKPLHEAAAREPGRLACGQALSRCPSLATSTHQVLEPAITEPHRFSAPLARATGAPPPRSCHSDALCRLRTWQARAMQLAGLRMLSGQPSWSFPAEGGPPAWPEPVWPAVPSWVTAEQPAAEAAHAPPLGGPLALPASASWLAPVPTAPAMLAPHLPPHPGKLIVMRWCQGAADSLSCTTAVVLLPLACKRHMCMRTPACAM